MTGTTRPTAWSHPWSASFPGVASVHELAGLASYRAGRWSQAITELEAARAITPSVALLPVLADCYRALRRWDEVEAIWQEVRTASPAHEIAAETRIVVAGSLADRGDLKAAIKLLSGATRMPKQVRDHHMRQWYVLADLYDRAGDTVAAAPLVPHARRHRSDVRRRRRPAAGARSLRT